VPRLELILMTKGFCCDIVLLFYGTALEFLMALLFLIATDS